MADPFIGEIRLFGSNFAPRGWALCNGQLLSIASNSALFSILGTTYGGDGETTFGLPDLRGRVPIGEGTGPGLRPRSLGQGGGTERVALTAATNAAHSHGPTLSAHSTGANADFPNFSGLPSSLAVTPAYSTGDADVSLESRSVVVQNEGAGQPHDNIQPFLAINYIIAIVGFFPS